MHTSPRRFCTLLLVLFAICLLAQPSALADEKEGGKEKETPKVLTAAKRPFVVTLDLKGTFVPNGAAEVAFVPKVYGGTLQVVEAAGAGPVVAGQTLVRFDDQWITRDLESMERDVFVARARLQRQEADVRQRTVLTSIERQRRTWRVERAEADFERYHEVDRARRIAQAEHNLKGTENRLQDDIEELEQLEKMYQADDLTEETEAIVIRRTRRNLARLRRSFEWAQARHRVFMEITLPREDRDKEIDLRKKKTELQAYLVMSETDLRTIELGLEKARSDFARLEKRLRELREDRDHLRLRAPRDGYAVPGYFKTSSWQDPEGALRVLRPDSRVKARQVLFSVVKPGDVGVRTTISESDLSRVKIGQRVEVRSTVASEAVLDGVVDAVAAVGTGGKHVVMVSLEETNDALMGGMSAKLKVELTRVNAAIVVPAGALKKDGGKHYLWISAKDGKIEKRAVKVGPSSGGKTVIKDGLAPGESFLETPPEEAK